MKQSLRLPDDLTLTCIDCETRFTFTAGERAYYASKALSPPKRCAACRERRRSSIVPDPAVSNE
jgi:hypothetical protein